MEREKIALSQRLLQRWHLMKMVEGGKITLKEEGEKIVVSNRQSVRVRRAVREKGMKGLIHGNMGRPSNHRIGERLRGKVFKLSNWNRRYLEFFGFYGIHPTRSARATPGAKER
jgi:hypothetical protein